MMVPIRRLQHLRRHPQGSSGFPNRNTSLHQVGGATVAKRMRCDLPGEPRTFHCGLPGSSKCNAGCINDIGRAVIHPTPTTEVDQYLSPEPYWGPSLITLDLTFRTSMHHPPGKINPVPLQSQNSPGPRSCIDAKQDEPG